MVEEKNKAIVEEMNSSDIGSLWGLNGNNGRDQEI